VCVYTANTFHPRFFGWEKGDDGDDGTDVNPYLCLLFLLRLASPRFYFRRRLTSTTTLHSTCDDDDDDDYTPTPRRSITRLDGADSITGFTRRLPNRPNRRLHPVPRASSPACAQCPIMPVLIAPYETPGRNA
jgi:hypothetical protein